MKAEKINTQKNQQCNSESSVLRVETEIKNTLTQEIDSLKKKKKGSGKINASIILEKVLPRLTEEDRAEILASTVTGEDRNKVAFSTYKKKHKKASKSEFQDLLQYGEININDYLPEDMRRHKKPSISNNLRSA